MRKIRLDNVCFAVTEKVNKPLLRNALDTWMRRTAERGTASFWRGKLSERFDSFGHLPKTKKADAAMRTSFNVSGFRQLLTGSLL